MNIGLKHFKTRAVFDRTTKQYLDISFIQNTDLVHTHDHIYQFVTPDMKGKLDTIRKITYLEFRDLQLPLEDGFYLYDDLGIFVVHTNNNVSGVSDSYLYMITSNGVEIYKWVSDRYGNVGNIGELEVTPNSNNVTISSRITATDTSEQDIPAATTTTAGVLTPEDKIKLNNSIPTCTAAEADGISLISSDDYDEGEGTWDGIYYCPERKRIYCFYADNHIGRTPYARVFNRVSVGYDNELGFDVRGSRYDMSLERWVENEYSVGELSIKETNQNYIDLDLDYVSENRGFRLLGATQQAAGLMVSTDKIKLDNLPTNDDLEEQHEIIARALNDLDLRITNLDSKSNDNVNLIEETQAVTSAALNDLNSRINELTENNTDLNSRLNELNEIIEENELITASALNYLNEKDSGVALRFISIEEDHGDAILSFSNLSAINKEFIDKLHQVLSSDEFEVAMIKLKSIVDQNYIYYLNYYPNVTLYSVNNQGGDGPDKIFVVNINVSMLPSGNNETINIQFILEGSDHTLIIQYVDTNGESDEIEYDFGAVSTDTNGIEFYELTHDDK